MKASYSIPVVLVTALLAPFAPAEDLRSGFATPMPEYSPVPIWWWSGDRIERDRLCFELERIASAEIHNAIVLNLAPSGPLYGSADDEYRFNITEAAKAGPNAVEIRVFDTLGPHFDVGIRAGTYSRAGRSRGCSGRFP